MGRAGRDLLIGGHGSDRIIGHTDYDILIAGWLDLSTVDQTFDAIWREWTSESDRTIRVENLNQTLVLGTTVKDSATDHDVLTGASGDDWFFFDQDYDKATDLKDEVFAHDWNWIPDI